MIWIILIIIIWYLIGLFGSIYVESLESDVDTEFLMISFVMAIFGILFPIMLFISNNPKVIIKKRNK